MEDLLFTIFEKFALPVAVMIVLIIGIVKLFQYFSAKDEAHDSATKEMTEKYYQSYMQVTESNSKVSEALNNNTKVIEKLLDKLDK